MADVEMQDAGSAKDKVAKTSKSGAGEASEGKKRFEVKKVSDSRFFFGFFYDSGLLSDVLFLTSGTPSRYGLGTLSLTTAPFAGITLWIYVSCENISIAEGRNSDIILGIECQANQGSSTTEECTVAWGICNVSIYFSRNIVPISNHRSPTARVSFPLHFEMVEDSTSVSVG